MRRRLRATATAVLAAGSLLGLAACSGGGSSSHSGAAAAPSTATPATQSVADVMNLATKRTESYRSEHVSMTMAMGSKGTSTISGRMSSGTPIAADLTETSADLSATTGSSIHVLMSGTVEYMNTGATAGTLDGKHWMKMDLAQLGGGTGQAFKSLANSSSHPQDASAALKLLTASGDVKRVGTGTVNGVQATEYAGTVDLAKLDATDPDLKPLLQQAQQEGMKSETVDVWLDKNDLPVKMHETSTVPSLGTMDITGTFSDYSDTPVTVTPPPASDTVDLLQALKAGGATGAN